MSFLTAFKALFTNKYFILALVLYLLWYLRQTENGIRVYYATYIFDDANLMAPMSLAALVPMILGLLIAPKLAGKFGVRRCVYWGLGISIVAYVIMTAFSESLPAMIIGLVINSIGLVPLQAALTAIVADVGDLVYWKTGVPVQGSVFSLTSAGMKSVRESPLRWLPGPSRWGDISPGLRSNRTAPSPPLNRCKSTSPSPWSCSC